MIRLDFGYLREGSGSRLSHSGSTKRTVQLFLSYFTQKNLKAQSLSKPGKSRSEFFFIN
jgi:hypothetical protein